MATIPIMSQVIRFNPEDEKQHGIIARSRVVLSPGRRPHGYVLRDLGDKFVTHQEMYFIGMQKVIEEGREYQGIILSHACFEQGNYFEFRPEGHDGFHNRPTREVALDEALQDWQRRCARL
jgi:hypothetical protein